jgi:hypothetical protein
MNADWLASRLAEGRSIESLAREAGRSPSTVAYWVNKHGLTEARKCVLLCANSMRWSRPESLRCRWP